MDVTLIPRSEAKYNKKEQKNTILDSGIAQLSDCALVLLHKAGLRPLYVMNGEKINLCISSSPKMSHPDLILFEQNDISTQSARVIQEQLQHGGCSVRMLATHFTDSENFEVFKNFFLTRLQQLEKKAYQHIIIIGEIANLNKIAHCLNEKENELNPNYNIPIYSYINGEAVNDSNLMGDNLYATRDILDSMLIYRLRRSKEKDLIKFSKTCHYPLEIFHIRKKLHLPD